MCAIGQAKLAHDRPSKAGLMRSLAVTLGTDEGAAPLVCQEDLGMARLWISGGGLVMAVAALKT